MLLSAISVLSVVVLELCVAEKLDLPAGMRTCKRDSANYNICLKQAIKDAWPLLAEGLPEYQFPSFDPLLYGNDKEVFNSDLLQGEMIFTNLTCEGLRKTRIVAVRTHLENVTFYLEIDIRISELFIQGGCEMQGTLGGFRMDGKGYMNITIGDIRDTWVISGHIKQDTWIIEHYQTTPTIKNMKLYLDNFFEGNRGLNKVFTMFVNEYWPPLFRVVLPIATKHFDKYITNLLNRLFSKLSFSQVFP